ncbi:TMEM175 family protein [Spirosoma arcticum]
MSAESSNTARLEAFSDGVFAIAVTLLVLDLKVPNLNADTVTDPQLRQQLLSQWPAYLGFLSSFLTILIIWVNHHYLFKLIHRTDRAFMFVNGLLLLLVTFIPFPTSLLSRYVLSDAAPTVAFVYSGTYLLLAVAFNLLWYSALRRGLVNGSGAKRVNYSGIRRGYLLGPLLYGGAAVVALFFPIWSIVICLAMAVFFAIFYYES